MLTVLGMQNQSKKILGQGHKDSGKGHVATSLQKHYKPVTYPGEFALICR